MNRLLIPFLSLLCLVGRAPAALAQVRTVAFELQDVWLLPDISHPGRPAVQMTGSFEWRYEVGDFENGTGQFTEAYIPWDQPRLDELAITVEVSSIEFSLNGNWHDRGVDLTLFLLKPLSLKRPSGIDTVTSLFEIQHGITYEGHVISGQIVPISALNCDLISKFKARCKNGRLSVKVTSSLPEGTELTIDNDGDLQTMVLNRKGKGKVSYNGQSGRRQVAIVECPQESLAVSCR